MLCIINLRPIIQNSFESQMGRDHWEDQDVDGWTILKWILER
jgi:hypothetical protein